MLLSNMLFITIYENIPILVLLYVIFIKEEEILSFNREKCFVSITIYLGLFVVFCCFGHLNNQTNSLTLEIFNPQAFEAIASSSGGIQTLIDACLNQDVKITTIRK